MKPIITKLLVLMSIIAYTQCPISNYNEIMNMTTQGDTICNFDVYFHYVTNGANNASIQAWIEVIDDGDTVKFGDDGECEPGERQSTMLVNGNTYNNSINVTAPCGATTELVWSGRTNPHCGGTTCGDGRSTVGALLPIELLYFVANESALKWATGSEVNNSGFSILRLFNKDWIPVGWVDGNGTQSHLERYYFEVDRGGYYMLNQIDYDGAETFSNIVYINNKAARQVRSVINMYGQKIDTSAEGLKIIIYDDGSVEKKY